MVKKNHSALGKTNEQELKVLTLLGRANRIGNNMLIKKTSWLIPRRKNQKIGKIGKFLDSERSYG